MLPSDHSSAPSRLRYPVLLRMSNLWHLKQHKGFGTYCRTWRLKKLHQIWSGRPGLLNVKIRVVDRTKIPSTFSSKERLKFFLQLRSIFSKLDRCKILQNWFIYLHQLSWEHLSRFEKLVIFHTLYTREESSYAKSDFIEWCGSSILTGWHIQGVTGPHRQNDRDDRPCREDHFL